MRNYKPRFASCISETKSDTSNTHIFVFEFQGTTLIGLVEGTIAVREAPGTYTVGKRYDISLTVMEGQ